jgi:ATP synthase protein I
MFPAVRFILRMQLATITLIAALFWLIQDVSAARAAGLGGCAAFLPNLAFAALFAKSSQSHTAQQVVRSFYVGETIKLFLTALLFVLIFQLPDIQFLPLFAGFVPTLMVFWLALLTRNS